MIFLFLPGLLLQTPSTEFHYGHSDNSLLENGSGDAHGLIVSVLFKSCEEYLYNH